MSNETKDDIKREIARRRPRFDDSELVMINKIRFLIDEMPTEEARVRAVRYLSDRYDRKGASGSRGVGSLIPTETTFE